MAPGIDTGTSRFPDESYTGELCRQPTRHTKFYSSLGSNSIARKHSTVHLFSGHFTNAGIKHCEAGAHGHLPGTRGREGLLSLKESPTLAIGRTLRRLKAIRFPGSTAVIPAPDDCRDSAEFAPADDPEEGISKVENP